MRGLPWGLLGFILWLWIGLTIQQAGGGFWGGSEPRDPGGHGGRAGRAEALRGDLRADVEGLTTRGVDAPASRDLQALRNDPGWGPRGLIAFQFPAMPAQVTVGLGVDGWPQPVTMQPAANGGR